MGNSDSDGPSWTIMGNSTCLPFDDPDAIWAYCPSEAAAILFAVLFSFTVFGNTFFAAKYRKPFCWVLIMATIWETAGYAVRAVATRYQQSLPFYFVQLLLVLLSPLLMNAFVYMVFARLVHFFDPAQKVAGIRARRLSVVFVCLDITSFMVQLVGASMLSSTDVNTLRNGKYLYMGGIGLQQLCILVFTGLVATFDRAARRAAGFRAADHRTLTVLVYVSLACITVRIIFRLVEYSQGFDSSIPRTESFQYIFDAVPMLLLASLWVIWHPGRVLVGEESEFPKISRADKKRMKQEKKAAKKQPTEGKDANLGLEPIRPYEPYERMSSERSFEHVDIQERGTYTDLAPSR